RPLWAPGLGGCENATPARCPGFRSTPPAPGFPAVRLHQYQPYVHGCGPALSQGRQVPARRALPPPMPDPPGGVHLHQLAVQQLGSEVPPEGQHLLLHAHRADARIALRASRCRTGEPPGVPTPSPNVGVMPSRGRMKILAPIRSCDELEMLVESGAEELYCGIVPREWMERYTGAMWLNRRSPNGSSLETYSDLKRLATDAHRAGLPVFVTLNGPYYTAGQIPLVLDLARRLSEEVGVDALIVTDINLLLRLSEEKLAAQIHVSSVAATLNSEAIRFLANFGPSRVILPRSLTIA